MIDVFPWYQLLKQQRAGIQVYRLVKEKKLHCIQSSAGIPEITLQLIISIARVEKNSNDCLNQTENIEIRWGE